MEEKDKLTSSEVQPDEVEIKFSNLPVQNQPPAVITSENQVNSIIISSEPLPKDFNPEVDSEDRGSPSVKRSEQKHVGCCDDNNCLWCCYGGSYCCPCPVPMIPVDHSCCAAGDCDCCAVGACECAVGACECAGCCADCASCGADCAGNFMACVPFCC